MDALGEYTLMIYVARMSKQLRLKFPDQLAGIDDTTLERRILNSIDNAEQYGIDKEGDVEKFLEYSVKYGVEFYKECLWAKKVLSDPEIDGSDKMVELEKREAVE